ncbi:MAG: hemolysin III family protein [Polyangiaceae bacterium]|nr:hemolysin III family protein [Polyangiaceae bacterium]
MDVPTAVAVRSPTVAEELVHALTHGLGAILAVGVLATLVGGAALHGSAMTVVATAVFGISLVLVYVSSTVYHAIPATLTRAKTLFQICDHVAIHLLIAGTFTPLSLCSIGGAWGWVLFGLVWAVAALGVVVETTSLRHSARLSIALYVGAGWLGVVALPLLWSTLPPGALPLIALGGLAYTAGVPFFLADHARWTHALWHGFVLAGSGLHAAAIALVVLP